MTYDNTTGTHDGQYELTLTDQTSGQSFSVWESCAATTCLNTAAEAGSGPGTLYAGEAFSDTWKNAT